MLCVIPIQGLNICACDCKGCEEQSITCKLCEEDEQHDGLSNGLGGPKDC